MARRPPPGACASCWQPHDYGVPCYPFVAEDRTYGDGGDGPSWTTDRLESFVLDATNPRQDTRRGCPGFQIEEAKKVAAALRAAFADGTLTVADLEPANMLDPVPS